MRGKVATFPFARARVRAKENPPFGGLPLLGAITSRPALPRLCRKAIRRIRFRLRIPLVSYKLGTRMFPIRSTRRTRD